MSEDFEHRRVVRGWIAAAERLVALTGAGISTLGGRNGRTGELRTALLSTKPFIR
jgi:hypothetical protein